MADPTLRLTFTSLQTRVAEFLGVADYTGGTAAPPSDAHDLDLVKRLINDGYRRFLTDYEWNFLNVPLALQFVTQYSGAVSSGTATTLVDDDIAGDYADDFFNGFKIEVTDSDDTIQVATVTDFTGATGTFTVAAWPSFTPADEDSYRTAAPAAVDGDNSRYYLPDDFYGDLIHPFTYGSNGPYKYIQPTSEAMIRQYISGQGLTTGDPTMSATRAINTVPTTDGDRWEVIFWPSPAGTHTVTAMYKRFPNALSSGTDTSVAGFQHDETVLDAALAAAELQRGDVAGPKEQKYRDSLSRSKRLDGRTRPSRMGDFGDKSEDAIGGLDRFYWRNYGNVSLQ